MGVLLLVTSMGLHAQQVNPDQQSVQEQALASFEEGDFRSALSGFKALMKISPKNAMNNYYAGRCLVELNEELDEAVELLYGASKSDVPGDVNYYLGLAYHRDYNFLDARKYFGRFEVNASRQELKEYNVKHMLGTTRSAADITATFNPYKVMNVTFMDIRDSLQFSQVKMKGGRLQRKPAAYYAADEDPHGLTSLVFVPPNAVRGDYIYFSGYSKNGKDGAQLFRVKKGSGKSWSEPREVKDLNSPGNDILPYFDPIESDLYFASDGRMGVGGFDLYRTHYDIERDLWSEPVNLGFPVNSTMDEYLLLPGSDLGMVMFFSTRQGTDSTVTVYRVHLVEPKKKTVVNDNVMLKEIAYLGDVAEDILAELKSLDSQDEPGHADMGSTLTAAYPQEDLSKGVRPAITEVTILPEETEAKPVYQITLTEALRHQAVSDSLKDLASSARALVRDSEDPNDRWVWQKQIMLWEKKARDEEALADDLYIRMEEEYSSQQAIIAASIPAAIEVDTVMEDLTVYQYTEPEPDLVSEPRIPVTTTGSVSNSFQSSSYDQSSVNRFEILASSPYSASNPIPMDVKLPGGALYRIQLGAFGVEVEPEAFAGISPVTGERIPDRGIVKYYAGKFSKYDDASSAISRIRSLGYEDAFIVAWYNGGLIPTQKAKQLE